MQMIGDFSFKSRGEEDLIGDIVELNKLIKGDTDLLRMKICGEVLRIFLRDHWWNNVLRSTCGRNLTCTGGK